MDLTERHENDSEEAKNEYFKPSRLVDGVHLKMLETQWCITPSDEASFVTGQTLCVNGGRTPW